MNFNKIKEAVGTSFKAAKMSAHKHSPEIFAGLGIGLFIASGVMAVLATPKATKELEEVKAEPKLEKVKVIAKNYAVPVLGAASATACVIKSVSTSTKRYAAISAAYSLSEEAFRTYKSKVIETIGEKKEKNITDAIAIDQLKNAPKITESGVITSSINPGPSLFYEPKTKTYFWADINDIKKRMIELSNTVLKCGQVSFYEWCLSLGITGKLTSEEANDYMFSGWSATPNGGVVTVDLVPEHADSFDGRPCSVFKYSQEVSPLIDW